MAKHRNVSDYLVDQTGVDFQRLFAHWQWRLSGTFTVWLINRFGDLFLEQEDGSIAWLRLDDGSLGRIAATKEEFLARIDEPGVANDWLMIPLVDRLVAAGKILQPKQCYAFLQLPILGGDYAVANIIVRDLEFQYAALGPIHEKLKDLPDGTNISFKVKE